TGVMQVLEGVEQAKEANGAFLRGRHGFTSTLHIKLKKIRAKHQLCMTSFKRFWQRMPQSGILCPPERAVRLFARLVKLSHILPLAENYAKWHKIKCTSLIVPENRTRHDVNHKCRGHPALR
ncbi:hypothetical protein ACLBP9_13240, partial [Klebsiella pneumoniae]|uniref:hypothetical protein n=1 Tax=Klebsiella pneumoniae TaxID=573 RepID=UPI00396858C2